MTRTVEMHPVNYMLRYIVRAAYSVEHVVVLESLIQQERYAWC